MVRLTSVVVQTFSGLLAAVVVTLLFDRTIPTTSLPSPPFQSLTNSQAPPPPQPFHPPPHSPTPSRTIRPPLIQRYASIPIEWTWMILQSVSITLPSKTQTFLASGCEGSYRITIPQIPRRRLILRDAEAGSVGGGDLASLWRLLVTGLMVGGGNVPKALGGRLRGLLG